MNHQFSGFNVEQGDDVERIHITVGDVYLIVKKTSDGLLVDVMNECSGDTVHKLSLTNDDISPGFAYKEEVRAIIAGFDKDAIIENDELQQAIDDDLEPYEAVEQYFSNNPFDLTTLTPLEGQAELFSIEVRKLTRPYVTITEGQYCDLYDKKPCYYLCNGGYVISFGRADAYGSDSDWALCKLRKPDANTLLKAQ